MTKIPKKKRTKLSSEAATCALPAFHRRSLRAQPVRHRLHGFLLFLIRMFFGRNLPDLHPRLYKNYTRSWNNLLLALFSQRIFELHFCLPASQPLHIHVFLSLFLPQKTVPSPSFSPAPAVLIWCVFYLSSYVTPFVVPSFSDYSFATLNSHRTVGHIFCLSQRDKFGS